MINYFFSLFDNLDVKVKKIMKNGFKFSFCFCIFATIVLLTYLFIYSSPELYYIGLKLVETSLFFAVEFIICGFAVDKIAKELI